MKLSYLPPQIVLLGLQPELADYLIAWFRQHRPTARVRHSDYMKESTVMNLYIVDRQPLEPVLTPTLWLAELDHSSSVHQLSPNLWRTAMPTSGRRLARALRSCLFDQGIA
jgi:hypothetical protein